MSYSRVCTKKSFLLLCGVLGPTGSALATPASQRQYITGSAVALHCCKAHAKINCKMGNSTSCKIVPLKYHVETLHTWLRRREYPPCKFWFQSCGGGASPQISEMLKMWLFWLSCPVCPSFLDPASRSNRWTDSHTLWLKRRDHLRLIGKRVVDFLLVLIELFSLGATAEALRANIGSKSAISLQREPVDPKFQVEGVTLTNHFSYQKTRLNDLSYRIKIWTDLSSVLSQFTRLTDRRTDRRTAFSCLYRVCIPCSAVKTNTNINPNPNPNPFTLTQP